MAWLLLLLLTKLLRRLLDLPALLSAVVLGFMHRALWTTLIATGRLTWVLVTAWTTPPLVVVAATVGAPSSNFSLSPYFFFFLPLPWAVASAWVLSAFPTFGVGYVCQAWPFVALAHFSARLKSSEMSCTSCVANFSSIFLSLMPYRNAIITEALEMWGLVFQT
jgi:hypothetical protein